MGLLVFLIFRGKVGPLFVHDEANGIRVQFVAVEGDGVDVDADDAGVSAAEVNLSLVNGGRAFEVDQFSREIILPQWTASFGIHAVKRGAVSLVHSIADDEQSIRRRRRGDDRQRDERRATRPHGPI